MCKADLLTRRYEAVSGEPLGDDLAASVMTRLCVKELRDQHGMTTKDMRYRDARELAVSHIERESDPQVGPRWTPGTTTKSRTPTMHQSPSNGKGRRPHRVWKKRPAHTTSGTGRETRKMKTSSRCSLLSGEGASHVRSGKGMPYGKAAWGNKVEQDNGAWKGSGKGQGSRSSLLCATAAEFGAIH